MTDTPAPRKLGRPATGRDPVVSIRLPKHLIEAIEATARYTESPAAKIYREALHLGLQFMKGERVERGEYLPPHLRPKHAAEIHEAGHAVAIFLCEQDGGETDLQYVVEEVLLKRRGGGLVRSAVNLEPEGALRMYVAGGVAQAIDERVSFLDIWNAYGCSADKRYAAALVRRHPELNFENAVAWVEAKFEDPDIWAAVVGLARELEHGKVSGSVCWYHYKTHLEAGYAQRDRASEHMGPVIDEDVVKRPRRRASKKTPRSR